MPMYVEKAGLQVADSLVDFIETQALPGTGIAAEAFWAGMADIYARFAPGNRALLEKRDALQATAPRAKRNCIKLVGKGSKSPAAGAAAPRPRWRGRTIPTA